MVSLAAGLLGACGPLGAAVLPTPPSPATRAVSSLLPGGSGEPRNTPAPLPLPLSSPTPIPTFTGSPTPIGSVTPTAPPTPAASPTSIGPCDQRIPRDELLTLVTRSFGISRDYEPADLVPLSDYLPPSVTLGYPTLVRQVILQPLLRLVADMEAAGLHPTIISGYRSYSAQSIAWGRWQDKEPERAPMLSAPPGFSEHQLGTAVDFGSPELPELVGEQNIEFHTDFYRTSEGRWLQEHATEHGFVLSFPAGSLELTGFYYEPWHYRYVGVDTARWLMEAGLTLTEYQLQNQPAPCIP